jgi:hypothetical protein
MSYSLEFHFEPAIQETRILRYFAARKYFTAAKNDRFFYQHPDTGVYFMIRLRRARDILLRKIVVAAEFEVNYNRPSFFGIEAEKELAEFVAAFQPRIEDPQIHGMGEGPYSGEAFLKAWNFGNLFAVRTGLSKGFDQNIASISRGALRTAWSWNYQRGVRERLNSRCFVPTIQFARIEGRPHRVVTWGEGMAILLPRVDYVLIGRIVAGEPQFGLASWSEVLEVVQRSGFDTTQDPLKLKYTVTPPLIADWVSNIPLIDFDAFKREHLYPYQIVDEEVIAAARDTLDRDMGMSDHA